MYRRLHRLIILLPLLLCAFASAPLRAESASIGTVDHEKGLQIESADLFVQARYGSVRFVREYRRESPSGWVWNDRWIPLALNEPHEHGRIIRRGKDTFAQFGLGDGQWELGEPQKRVITRLASGSGSSGSSGGGTIGGSSESYGEQQKRAIRLGRPRILETATGYRWRDFEGNWIDYTPDGAPSAYGWNEEVHARFALDAEGRITEVRDHQSRLLLTIGYNTSGNEAPSFVEDYTGRRVSYHYDTTGKLVSVTDSRNQQWHYTYDNEGRILSAEEPNGHRTQYGYDLNATTDYQITFPDGLATRYYTHVSSSDNSLVIFYQTQPDGTVFETTYGKSRNSRTMPVPGRPQSYLSLRQELRINNEVIEQVYTNRLDPDVIHEIHDVTVFPDGRHEQTYLNLQGKITRRQYADGTAEYWQYEANSPRVQQYTDRTGTITTYSYDEQHRLVTRVEAVGTAQARTTEYQYPDLHTRIVSQSGEGGGPTITWREHLDAYGNVAERIDPEGNKTTYTHNAMGQVLSVTLPEGNTHRFEYDAAGNLLKAEDPLGRVTEYQYDPNGNITRLQLPNEGVYQFQYGPLSELIAVVDPLGHQTEFSVNRETREQRQRDARGYVTRQLMDAKGLPLQVVDASGNAASMTWQGYQLVAVDYPTFQQRFEYQHGEISRITDRWAGGERTTALRVGPLGQVLEQYDALNNLSSQSFDPLERLEAMTDALGGITRLTYDHDDNLLSLTDPEGRATRFEYDRLGQVLAEIIEPEPGVVQRREYRYDGNGNLIEVITPKGERRQFQYDQADQLTEIRLYHQPDDDQPSQLVTFTYNTLGQITHYDDGDTRTSYTYDLAGQLLSITTDYGVFSKTQGFTYHPDGLLASYTNPEGITYRYHYTPNALLARVDIPGEGSISFTDHQWLQPTRINLPGGHRIEREYDGLQRLVENRLLDAAQLELTHQQNHYDLMDNLLYRGSQRGNYQFDYDHLYRLIGAVYPELADEQFGYDGVGNRTLHQQAGVDSSSLEPLVYNNANQLLQRGNTLYEYNANGHLIRETDGSTSRLYHYDANERLTKVTTGTGSTLARYGYNPFGHRMWKEVGGQRTYFLYNASGMVAEYSASGALIQEYHYPPGNTWMTDPLFTRTQGQVYYYHNDHLGTPQTLINRQGATVWQASYTAFGEASIHLATVRNPLRFPGQYHDDETGLNHNFHRDYSATLGRYVQRDPIGLAGGLNTYAYAYSNPLAFIDPSGETPLTPFYARCVAQCLAGAGVGAGLGYLVDRILCDEGPGLGTVAGGLTGTAAGCAASCINPFNWFGKRGSRNNDGNVTKKLPGPDGGFTADLSKSKAKSRSGHRNAGNKQLHDKMKSDPNFRADMERRHGSDVFDRTSTSGSGRRNPAGTEWDHSSTNPNSLDLRTIGNHRQKTSAEGQQGGGWKRFHRN